MKDKIKIFPAAFVLLIGVSFAVFYFFYNNNEEARPAPANQNVVYETAANNEGQVTVSVTPKNLAKGAASWDFEVVLDTHSAELDYDLMQNSVLIDSAGNKYPPLKWVGDPPGGHHRKGVLKFRPLAGSQGPIKLELYNVGGVAKRDFIWKPK